MSCALGQVSSSAKTTVPNMRKYIEIRFENARKKILYKVKIMIKIKYKEKKNLVYVSEMRAYGKLGKP